jgi:hypothetical protein
MNNWLPWDIPATDADDEKVAAAAAARVTPRWLASGTHMQMRAFLGAGGGAYSCMMQSAQTRLAPACFSTADRASRLLLQRTVSPGCAPGPAAPSCLPQQTACAPPQCNTASVRQRDNE